MREIETKVWILSFDELRILLASLGYVSIDGIFMEDKVFSRSDVINSMFHMQKAECITEQDDQFLMDEDLEKMLRIIGEPDDTEILEADSGRQVFCYYKAEDVVVSERYFRKKDSIRLYGFSHAAFMQWRKENFDDSDQGERALY